MLQLAWSFPCLLMESTSGLDEAAAEHIAQTVNALRGRVTMVFVAHRVPKGLQVDRHVDLAGPSASGQSGRRDLAGPVSSPAPDSWFSCFDHYPTAEPGRGQTSEISP